MGDYELKWNKSIVSIFIALLFVSFIVLPHALAATTIPKQTIVVFSKENVDTIVAVDRPVIVRGTVSNSIIAIGQDVTLADGSHTGFILAIGGQVHQSATAEVTEGILEVGTDHSITMILALAALLSLFLYASHALLSALLMLVLLFGGWLIIKRDETISDQISEHYARMALTGFIMTVILALLVGASILTPLLLPVSAIFLVLYLVSGTIGLIFVSNKLGRTILRAMIPSTRFAPFVMGSLGILLLTNIPFIGILLFILLWFISLGALWTTLWHKK